MVLIIIVKIVVEYKMQNINKKRQFALCGALALLAATPSAFAAEPSLPSAGQLLQQIERDAIIQPLPGVKAVDGAQIALKGKFSSGTADSFKTSGVKFKQDSRGGFVDAAVASVLSKMKDKLSVEYETSVVVGTDCEKAVSEECKI